MKKLFCLLLGLSLLLSASALAEYDQYRLTVGDVSVAVRWEVFPLDEHNVIVRAHNPGNWHVTWYRDGEPVRDLVPQGDYDQSTSAEPVFEPDGSFTMLCRIPSDKPETNRYSAPPPNASARWTEEGLTGITPLEERVRATRWDNRIVFYETDQYQRIRYNGKDTIIPLELAETMGTSRCIALVDGVFLDNYRDRDTEESGIICLDHGNIRYRIPRPDCCAELDIPYERISRPSVSGSWKSLVRHAENAEHAARMLSETGGNILLTTGSQTLEIYAAAVPAKRLWVRVLPTREALELCERSGIHPSHIIAMQGPFSAELNGALYDQFWIRVMVTKDSGIAGGLEEKVLPALAREMDVIVIDRPDCQILKA